MIVAGIDPGTIKAGVAVVEMRGSRLVPILVDTLEMRKRDPVEKRIYDLHRRVLGALSQHRPWLMVLERAYVAKDPRAALVIGEARGAVIAAAGYVGCRIEQLQASQARKTACLRGNMKKADARTFVRSLLGLSYFPLPDAADAGVLACAGAIRWNPQDPLREPVLDDSTVDREIRTAVRARRKGSL